MPHTPSHSWTGEERNLLLDEDTSLLNINFHVISAKKLGNFTTFEKYYIIPGMRWLLSLLREMEYTNRLAGSETL